MGKDQHYVNHLTVYEPRIEVLVRYIVGGVIYVGIDLVCRDTFKDGW